MPTKERHEEGTQENQEEQTKHRGRCEIGRREKEEEEEEDKSKWRSWNAKTKQKVEWIMDWLLVRRGRIDIIVCRRCFFI